MPAHARRSPRILASLIFALMVGCGVQPMVAAPWDEPVAEAVAVTEWIDEGQPGHPFNQGRDVRWSSAQQLLDSIVQSLAAVGDGVDIRGEVAGTNASGTVIAWVRAEGNDDGVVAVDLRIHMRNDAGSWAVAAVERREHCRFPLQDEHCSGER